MARQPTVPAALVRAAAGLPNEDELQESIVDGLTRTGHTVLQVGKWVKGTRCPKCRHFFTPRTGFGNSKGTPDLFISHPGWSKRLGFGIWIGCELKAPGGKGPLGTVPAGKVKPEQQALVDLGLTTLIHSWEAMTAFIEKVRG